MNLLLKRFWIEFDDTASLSVGVGYGCGVTAFDLNEALAVLQEQVFIDEPMPEIRKITEDIDVSTLDPNHVLPNIGITVDRGVWFPKI